MFYTENDYLMEVFAMSSYGKGSIGVSMCLVKVRNGREVKKRPPRRCDCKKCVHAIVDGSCINCYITGEVAVNKMYCNYFITSEDLIRERAKVPKKSKGPKKRYSRKRKNSKQKKGGGKHD